MVKKEPTTIWEYKKLGDILEIQGGSQPPKSNFIYEPKKGYVQLLQIRDFGERGVPTYVPTKLVTKFCKKDDILIARYGASLGRIVTGLEGAYNVALAKVIDERGLFNKRFIYYLLKTPIFQNPLKLLSRSAQNGFSKGEIAHIELPVPTLKTQQRIVSKIEELFSELDKGIDELKTAQQQLKVYRQAVLKWAFEGKLTNENVKDGELPEGWQVETLGNVSETCLGKMLDKQKNKGSLRPYLRNISVRWGNFNLDDLEQMKFEENELERYSLKKGDLVVCEGGEPGRCAIWNLGDGFMMIQKALHRVRVNENVNVKYVYYFMFFSGLNGTLEKYFTGTTIKHLTGKELKKIIFPLPSIQEQQQVVQEIETRISVCDKTEETITATLKQAEALRQSILKKAFEGRLI
jgi:type I restriction enzyme S subunit